MPLTVIIGEDKSGTATRIENAIRDNVEGANASTVSYVALGGVVRTDREVAVKMAKLVCEVADGHICFAIDQTVQGNENYGFDVIWELSRELRAGAPVRDFLVDVNFLVVIITHFRTTTVDRLVTSWNGKQAGCIGPKDVEIIRLSTPDDIASVLQARQGGRSVVPVVQKSIDDKCFWDLLKKWAG